MHSSEPRDARGTKKAINSSSHIKLTNLIHCYARSMRMTGALAAFSIVKLNNLIPSSI